MKKVQTLDRSVLMSKNEWLFPQESLEVKSRFCQVLIWRDVEEEEDGYVQAQS